MAVPLTLIKGTLDALVLRALSLAPKHGFEVVEWLESHSGGQLDIEDSAVYQALYRLEGRRLVSVAWGVTENNRRARYYATTAAGRTHLRVETAQLIRYATTLTAILTSATEAS